MFFALLAAATAAELVAYLPGGPPFPGDEADVVILWPAGVPADDKILVSSGELLGAPAIEAPGRIRQRWRAPAAAGPATWAVGGVSGPVQVRSRPRPSLVAQETRDAVAWAGQVELAFTGNDLPSPDQIAVSSSEGRVLGVRTEGTTLVVTVVPSPERVARVLAVGVLDLRTPGQLPAFATVRLRAHHGGQVTAEPGSRLSIRIGGRSYGPWEADGAGAVSVSFDAMPGESSYELLVADDLGNTQKSSNPVPTVSRATMVALPRAPFDTPGAWIAAWDARGVPGATAVPTCRIGGTREPATALDRGSWAWALPSSAPIDAVAVCSLGEATATVRVAKLLSEPTQLLLRVYPEQISVDFPLAEVQAWLVDEEGERLAPDGIVLSAGLGRLSPVKSRDAVRADYDGSLAAPTGGDEIRATWRLPEGRGAAAGMDLCIGGTPESREVVVRVLDATRRPLRSAPVELGTQDIGSGESRRYSVLTDDRGFLRLPIDAVPRRIWATAGLAMGEAVSADAADVLADCLPRADASGADLTARFQLPISAGRVRQVSIETEPRTLTLNPGASARVRVKLLDGAGMLVRDESVAFLTSEGTLSATTVDVDGSIVATLVPDNKLSGRTVQITAIAGETRVATTLELVPRDVRGAVAISAGYLTNLGPIEGPTAGIAVEHRLPLGGLAIRAGAAAYGLESSIRDELSGETILVRGTFFPVDAGLSYSQRGPRWSLAANIGLALVPYGLSAEYPGGPTSGGPGLSAPGVVARGSAGYRLGQAEIFFEAGYLLYTVPDSLVSVSGNAGGLTASLGYRLLY